eukprot:TRINITY_DN682_c0_g1_i1.p1 TRINITY_DN682_c0_g1~~TRINITY_DN682_c0_g1_i1.p1  ORF type:complete len:442 (+),score=75.92 TRINITY_DN682_c0_g1_i1:269-1594(+)
MEPGHLEAVAVFRLSGPQNQSHWLYVTQGLRTDDGLELSFRLSTGSSPGRSKQPTAPTGAPSSSGVSPSAPATPRFSARAPPSPPGPGPAPKRSEGGRRCAHCGVNSTVLWRQGPSGKGTLCNACGVKWKRGVLRPIDDISHSPVLSYQESPLSPPADATPPLPHLQRPKKKQGSENQPPLWPINLIENVARHLIDTGHNVVDGTLLEGEGPLCLDEELRHTKISAVVFVRDTDISQQGLHSDSRPFFQMLGITLDELEAMQCWNSIPFLHLLSSFEQKPLVTDMNRPSAFETHPKLRALVERATATEGSATSVLTAGSASVAAHCTTTVLQPELLGLSLPSEAAVRRLWRTVASRLAFGRSLKIESGIGQILCFHAAPATTHTADTVTWHSDGGTLHIVVPSEVLANPPHRVASPKLDASLSSEQYAWPGLDGLVLLVQT